MGTRSNSRRSRGSKRGLASFVSFVVLFALALGQGSSLTAFADDASRSTALPSAQPTAKLRPRRPVVTLGASSDGGTASTSRTAPKTSQLKTASSGRTGVLAAPPVAAGSTAVTSALTSSRQDHSPTTTRRGSEARLRVQQPDDQQDYGVVESLEGGDFECGDLVVFFTQVAVDGPPAGGSGSVDINMAFGAETTGQPGIGFVDVVDVAVNTGDSGMTDTGTTTVATAHNEQPADFSDPHPRTTVETLVTGLDAGDVIIVKYVVRLGCQVGASPTGNIQSLITGADVITPEADRIPVGSQVVPLKKVEDVAQPGMTVSKTCPEYSQIGSNISYSISIENTGNETLNITSVMDTVNGHAPVNITASFPATVAAGAR